VVDIRAGPAQQVPVEDQQAHGASLETSPGASARLRRLGSVSRNPERGAAMAPQTVHADQSGRVLTVRLDNPPRNFMNMRMVGELEQLVHDLEGDRSIGAVVITGAVEGVFITHFDVNEIRRSSERVAASVSSAQAGGTLRAVGAVQRIPGARSIVGRSPVGGLSALLQIHELFLRMNRLDK